MFIGAKSGNEMIDGRSSVLNSELRIQTSKLFLCYVNIIEMYHDVQLSKDIKLILK